MKNCILLFMCLFVSCIGGLKTRTLKSKQKVAVNSRVYNNKTKFNKAILHDIDTSAIYEEIYSIQYVAKNPFSKKLTYLYTSYPSDGYKGAYRFYSNGCYNLFILKTGATLTGEMFDPNLSGWRGVFYVDKKNIVKGDLITKVSGIGTIGVRKENFTVKSDTLYVTKKKLQKVQVFVKKQVPIKFLTAKGEW